MPGKRKFEAFDASGRRFEVTEDVWRDKVLPPLIKEHLNDADALVGVLHLALNDGFFNEALPGAKKLVELEPRSERAALILANTYWKLGRSDDSLRAIERFHARHEPTATSLAHLATLAEQRGEPGRAATLLWDALLLDPNNDKAANWWPLLERDRAGGGRDVHAAALQRLAELPGAWRAHVGLARLDLDVKQIDGAIAHFEEALRRGPDAETLLLTVSGDLGIAGRPGDALRLVIPHYDSTRHNPLIGVNLVEAAIEIGDFGLGERLLERLNRLDRWDLKERLADLRRTIELKKQSEH
jgi:tetratricopeptide (TPR) repeat protein